MSAPTAANLLASETPCNACKKTASLRCDACPTCDPTWYCSKECQKTDWSDHKTECKTKLFYSHARELKWPLEYPKINALAFVTGYTLTSDMKGFLRDVPINVRMVKLNGDNGAAGVESRRLIDGLGNAAQLPREAYIIRGRNAWPQYEKLPLHEVPIEYRPITWMVEKGSEYWEEGLPVFLNDYEKLSYKLYVYKWGNPMYGRGAVKIPWADIDYSSGVSVPASALGFTDEDMERIAGGKDQFVFPAVLEMFGPDKRRYGL